MKQKRKITQWIGMLGVAALVALLSHDASASPLYGGYNGESERWAEVYLLEESTIGFSITISMGADPDLDVSWSRVSISSLFLLPYIYNLELSYETGDIMSAAITTLQPWPTKFGADTNNLRWVITNLILTVRGEDTNNNAWEENGIPGLYLYASGEDNHDHQWEWVKVLFLLVGQRKTDTSTPGFSLSQKNPLSSRAKGASFYTHCAKEYEPRLRSLLGEKFSHPKLRNELRDLSESLGTRIAQLPVEVFAANEQRGFPTPKPSAAVDAELNALLHYAEEEIFTEEIRNELNNLLNAFMRDVEPLF